MSKRGAPGLADAGSVDLGMFAELLHEAARFGLGLYVDRCDREAPAHWHVGVMGIVGGETLATGDTLAEAVEFSFLPLRAYAESGLEPGFSLSARSWIFGPRLSWGPSSSRSKRSTAADRWARDAALATGSPYGGRWPRQISIKYLSRS
jgi:hypothetical protein